MGFVGWMRRYQVVRRRSWESHRLDEPAPKRKARLGGFRTIGEAR
jgi:hypothetical protein